MKTTMTELYRRDPAESLKIDEESVEKKIASFIKEKTYTFSGVVVGLSGGIDSSVCAALAVKAIGSDKVHGLILPAKTTSKEDIKDAKDLAETLTIQYKTVDITGIYESINKVSFSKDRIRQGNIMARIRMIILRDFAHSKNLLVLGTGNKSELTIGYFTKNGDSGVDILPIGDLYKTQVRELAKHLNISDNIISKAPTAGLWHGQTDEDEIGVKYETLDKILLGLELGLTISEISEIIKAGKDTVDKIKERIKLSSHKTGPIPIQKVN